MSDRLAGSWADGWAGCRVWWWEDEIPRWYGGEKERVQEEVGRVMKEARDGEDIELLSSLSWSQSKAHANGGGQSWEDASEDDDKVYGAPYHLSKLITPQSFADTDTDTTVFDPCIRLWLRLINTQWLPLPSPNTSQAHCSVLGS